MRIYLVRHAIAVARGTKHYPGDDRPLTPRGVARMKRNAQGIRRLRLKPDSLLHSPLLRARDTAAILVRALDDAPAPTETDELLPDADPAGILALIRRARLGPNVMLVGHEPHLGLLAALLTGSAGPPLLFRKGGMARIDAGEPSPGAGRLVWLLTPRLLRTLDASR